MPAIEQLVHWLTLAGQNLVIGIVVVFVYATFRTVFENEKTRGHAIVIGIVCGLGAAASIALSYDVAAVAVRADFRSVFILLAGLFGGPIGATIAVAMSIVARTFLVALPLPIGFIEMISAGLIGVILAQRQAKRKVEYNVPFLLLAGAFNAIFILMWVDLELWIDGRPSVPFEAQLSFAIACSAATMILGTSLLLTHPRIWRLTQRHLAELLETTTDLIWEIDEHDRITYISERYHELLGYRTEDLYGKTFAAMGLQWIDDATKAALRAALIARKPFDQLLCMVPAKDGTPFYLSVTGRPAVDNRGRFIGFRGIASDVTERQRLEAKEREYAERLDAAQRVGKIGSVESDLVAGTMEWSSGMYSLLGIAPDAAAPGFDRLLESVHPDDREALRALRASVVAGGPNDPGEFRIVRPDGAVRHLLRQSETVRNPDGRAVKIIATLVDVTEMRHIQERLRISHENLVHAQMLGRIGSAQVDLAAGGSTWSIEQCHIYGIDPSAVPQTLDAYLALLHPDDREMFAAISRANNRGEATDPVEFRIIRPNGEMRWIHREAEVQFDARGKPSLLFTTQQDITDRRRLEDEHRRHLDREAQAGKVEALGNLAGGIAHDFNNLLGAILGFGRFLMEDLPEDSEQHGFAQRIVDVTQRGRSLVQQILTFARRTETQRSDVVVKALIEEAANLLRATLPATTQLVLDNRVEDAVVHADGGQLIQVLVNLCVNGSDALAEAPGTVTITVNHLDKTRDDLAMVPPVAAGPSPASIETRRGADGVMIVATGAVPRGDGISIVVTDTGSGIPEALMDGIFEPFRTTKAKGRGTGLGLAVVHRIVREHGGAILVRSRPGAGTTFEVVLGTVADSAVPAVGHGVASASRPAKTASGSILVVDDNEDYCAMIRVALERFGYAVRTSTDPRTALEWAQAGGMRWDVLVTDQTMPHIRGTDLIAAFRILSPATRCILCSGYSSGMDEQKALALGASAFMIKPFEIDQLIQVVGQLTQEIRAKVH